MKGMSRKEYRALRKEFFRMVDDRRRGAKGEYGELGFMKNDTFEMICEELADMANYCMFTYVKVREMERRVNALRTNSADHDAGRNSAGIVSDGSGAHVPGV